MGFLVFGLQLERPQEGGFRPVQVDELEAHEAEIEKQRGGLGVELDELAVDRVRFPELFLLEICQSQEVQDGVVARPEPASFLELLRGIGEIAGVEMLATPVEVHEKEPLVEGRRGLIRHKSTGEY